MKKLTMALAGNPNSGKTTIFNNLTGARQKVGNWPGVTVEKKEGTLKWGEHQLKVVDLPGTYSLTPFSIEEIAARDFILEEKPDVVVNIIDAANLERSLYLAMQIMELDRPVVFVLNMADLARSKGITIDAERLSMLLDVPVIFTVGNRDQGMDTLVETAIHEAQSSPGGKSGRKVKYNRDIETLISELIQVLEAQFHDHHPHPVRWTAIKLLESDQMVKKSLEELSPELEEKINQMAARSRSRLEKIFHDDPEIVLTDDRYGFIAGIVKEVVTLSPRKTGGYVQKHRSGADQPFPGISHFYIFHLGHVQLTFPWGRIPWNGLSPEWDFYPPDLICCSLQVC